MARAEKPGLVTCVLCVHYTWAGSVWFCTLRIVSRGCLFFACYSTLRSLGVPSSTYIITNSISDI